MRVRGTSLAKCAMEVAIVSCERVVGFFSGFTFQGVTFSLYRTFV